MTATLRTDVEPADVLYDAELKAAVTAWCHHHGLDPNKVTRLNAVSEGTVEVEQHVTGGSHGTMRLLDTNRIDVLRFRYTVHTSETPPWVR